MQTDQPQHPERHCTAIGPFLEAVVQALHLINVACGRLYKAISSLRMAPHL